MTIKKTYELQVVYQDDSFDHIERKALTPAEALKDAKQEYPTAHHISVTGRKNDAKWRRYYKTYQGMPIFPHNPNRFGEYVYRHKGRPAKGRKVQRPCPYGARLFLVGWEVFYDTPTINVLQDWLTRFIGDSPIEVPADV